MANPILSFPQLTETIAQPTNAMNLYPVGTPVLTNPSQPPARPKPALTTPSAPATGNARGSARGVGFPTIPDNRIDMMSEGLMRIGGAGLSAGDDGLSTYGAMLGQYGNLQDMNRQNEMDRYNAELAQAQEEQRRKELQARISASAAKESDKKNGDTEGAAKALVSLQNAQDVLDGFDKRDGIVGWQSFFLRGWDQMSGDERENIRLKIESMKVDRVLANIAQTKGAISEKEMEIFMSDQPSWLAGEEIWRKWITDYMAAIRVMHTNLQNGTTVENGASISTMSDSGDYTIEEVTPSDT